MEDFSIPMNEKSITITTTTQATPPARRKSARLSSKKKLSMSAVSSPSMALPIRKLADEEESGHTAAVADANRGHSQVERGQHQVEQACATPTFSSPSEITSEHLLPVPLPAHVNVSGSEALAAEDKDDAAAGTGTSLASEKLASSSVASASGGRPRLQLPASASASVSSSYKGERAVAHVSSALLEKLRGKVTVQTLRSTKALTIPVTPVSHLAQRHGLKVYSTQGPAPHEDPPRALQPPARGAAFEFRPFQQLTEQRIPVTRSSRATTPAPVAVEPRRRLAPTVPEGPHLWTEQRAKSTGRPRPRSREEREAEEMAAVPVFRATPAPATASVTTTSMTDGETVVSTGLGARAAKVRPLTVPVDLALLIDRRLDARRLATAAAKEKEREDEGAPQTFKARPMPSFEPAVATGVSTAGPQPASFQPTVPVSPRITKRATSAPPVRRPSTTATADTVKTSGPRPLTEPEEFSLESVRRSLVARAQLAQRRRQEEEQQTLLRASLRAQPVPDFSRPFQPAPSARELTDFRDFALESVVRHEQSAAQQRRAAAIAAEQAVAASVAFRARQPPRSLHEAPPPPPLPSSVAASDSAGDAGCEVRLHSEARAAVRRDFDEGLAQRQGEREAQRREQARLREDKENEALNELRRLPISEGGLLFKATPVMAYEDAGVGGGSNTVPRRALTEPESPHLLIDRRMQLRRQCRGDNQ